MSLLSKAVRRIWHRKPRPAPRPEVRSSSALHEVHVRDQRLFLNYVDETAQYEPQVLDYIDRLKPGETFYDLGACVGFFSLYAAARGLNSHALEIEAKNFAALQSNLSANQRLQVQAFQVGVSDGASEWADLRVGQNHAGGHHKTLVSDEFAGPANIVHQDYEIERVRVDALDRFIKRNQLAQPQHMKIDIDGSEVLFMRGAAQTLASASLRSLMFELYEASPFFDGILKQLAEYGFSLIAKHPIDQPWPGCEQLFNCEFWKP